MSSVKYVQLPVTLAAPSEATHYSGLPPEVLWWKHMVNSTGTVAMWCYWEDERLEWLLYSEHMPNGLVAIP